MARPLREQFLVAALVLLVPVGAIMALLAERAYWGQMLQLSEDAHVMARMVAAHIDASGPEEDAALQAFLDGVPLPEGGHLVVLDEDGREIARRGIPTTGVEEVAARRVDVARHPWTVRAALPTEIAWSRARAIYQGGVLVAGLATLILLGLQGLFLRRWLPSLRELERSADRIGAGDLSSLPPGRMPARELQRVRDAFADMVEKLRAARSRIAAQVDEERRMRQELQSLQQQVIRQERLAAIGVLLSGIAHELNNPLQAITGLSDLVRRDPDLHEQARADLILIQKESARASAIIRNLTRFSRQQGAPPSIVLLPDVIGSVVELRQRRLQEQDISIDVDDQASQPVRAIPAELQQVLLNFVVNAEHAIVSSRSAERRIVLRTFDMDRGVRVEVEDTGPGVPVEDESKLFQPFFTTKPVGQGTGLGLSVSYGIIGSLKGTIGYQRAPGGGALFYFELPALDDPDVSTP